MTMMSTRPAPQPADAAPRAGAEASSATPSAALAPGAFAARHLGPDDAQVRTMLDRIGRDRVGVASLDDLVAATMPEVIRLDAAA